MSPRNLGRLQFGRWDLLDGWVISARLSLLLAITSHWSRMPSSDAVQLKAAYSGMAAMPNGPDALQGWQLHQSTCTLPACPVGLSLASSPPMRSMGSEQPRPVFCTATPPPRAGFNALMRVSMGSPAGTVDPFNTCGAIRRQWHHRAPDMARQEHSNPGGSHLEWC